MIQFISHYTERYGYLDSIAMALEGGCRWIQLRMKGASDEEFLTVARKAKKMCKEHDAAFIIDDRVHLVKRLRANGVHLGKSDMPIREARALLGDNAIIGATANTFEDVKAHYGAGANYIGCGPFRFTTTKENLSPVLGEEGYREIMERMKASRIRIPVVAIGGITAEDIPVIMKTGVRGVALSGAVLSAENPVAEMERLRALMNSWNKDEGIEWIRNSHLDGIGITMIKRG